jgi:hypothetical protein
VPATALNDRCDPLSGAGGQVARGRVGHGSALKADQASLRSNRGHLANDRAYAGKRLPQPKLLELRTGTWNRPQCLCTRSLASPDGGSQL